MKNQSKYCGTCNRWVLSEKCFQNHLTLKVKGKLVRKWRQLCRNCSFIVTTDSKHECFKRCNYCIKRQPSGHFFYVATLKPSKLQIGFVCFLLIRSAHRTLKSMMGPFEHSPNLICAQQMCSKCEAVDELNVDCTQCGKRTHVFWAEDPVGKFIDYLRQSRPFADKIYVISHNSRGYDAQFLLRKFLKLRWTPQLIMDSTKILSMVVENMHFLDSLNFLPMSLKSMPKSFDLSCKKGY